MKFLKILSIFMVFVATVFLVSCDKDFENKDLESGMVTFGISNNTSQLKSTADDIPCNGGDPVKALIVIDGLTYISESIKEIPIKIDNTIYFDSDIYSKNHLFYIDIQKYKSDTLYITSEIILIDENNQKILSSSGYKEKRYGDMDLDGLKWVWYSEYTFKK